MNLLPHNIKAKIAQRAHALLERYAGVYITTDTDSKEASKKWNVGDSKAGDVQAKGIRRDFAKRMGRDLHSFMFETDRECKVFFENLGFKVQVYHHKDFVNHISSVDVLYPDKKQRKLVEDKHLSKLIFAMTLK